MAHFAEIDENNIVIRRIVAEQEFIDSGAVGDPSKWIQTSYNTHCGIHCQPNTRIPSEDQSRALRKNFAGKGFYYDKERDAFIPPKPFPSWTLNEKTCCWDPPLPRPPEGNYFVWWDEECFCWKTKVPEKI